ncbi:MAG: aminodeoxychorismate synthase component I [Planctomycetota bacterium]
MSSPLVLPVSEGPPLPELAAGLSDDRLPALLDSGGPEGPLARWSLLAFDPVDTVQARARPGGAALDEVWNALRRRWPDARPGAPDEDLPAFRGGAVGWLGYDLGRELERLPAVASPDADVPDLHVGLFPFALAHEHATGRRLVVGRGSRDEAEAFAREVASLEERATTIGPVEGVGDVVASTFDRPGYEQAVERVREHILDGDVYQVNLAQRFEVACTGRPEALHAALRERFPAPFGALLRAPGVAVISSSPELFLRKRGARVQSRPIKGTRPRHADPARDAELRAALESSEKEQAELAMIVDLVRNDLGRTASVGSVRVEQPFETDAWSTVFHRVATVHAETAADTSALDVVRGAFPPASVTGTPKIRALEVIESLEPVRRQVYTGAIGWLGADGDLALSVAIRIATLVDGRLLIPVGSGITLASDPAAEYEETLHKARAIFEVLGLPLPLAEVTG